MESVWLGRSVNEYDSDKYDDCDCYDSNEFEYGFLL